ncbi:MAG: hypothetical protein HQ530_04025 [Parcubacteria group bacterium]|nr:hypothetical protein [Parcubacteria group bacterium]
MDKNADRARVVNVMKEKEGHAASIKDMLKSPEDTALLMAILKDKDQGTLIGELKREEADPEHEIEDYDPEETEHGLAERLVARKINYESDLGDLYKYQQEIAKIRETTKELKSKMSPDRIRELAFYSSGRDGDTITDPSELEMLSSRVGYEGMATVIKHKLDILFVEDPARYQKISECMEGEQVTDKVTESRHKKIGEVCKEYKVDMSLVAQISKIEDETMRTDSFRVLIDPDSDTRELKKVLDIKDERERDEAFGKLVIPVEANIKLPNVSWSIRKAMVAKRIDLIKQGVSDLEDERELYNDEQNKLIHAQNKLGLALGGSISNKSIQEAIDIALISDDPDRDLKEQVVSGAEAAEMMLDSDEIDLEVAKFHKKNKTADKSAEEQAKLTEKLRKKLKGRVTAKGKKSLGILGEIAQWMMGGKVDSAIDKFRMAENPA